MTSGLVEELKPQKKNKLHKHKLHAQNCVFRYSLFDNSIVRLGDLNPNIFIRNIKKYQPIKL